MYVGDARRRGSVLSILSLILLFVLAGCASDAKPPATAGATAPGTATVTFHAFTGTGRLAVPAAARPVQGECWTTSIAAPNATAYRCFQGNKILDPCFAPAHPTTPAQLACLQTPWSRAVVLSVHGRLPAAGDGAIPARPWAVQLSNGARCVASTGTVPAVGGVNLGYHCTDGGDAALVATGPSALTARYAAPHATRLATMTVTTVWDA
jgi:hypothetical protein